MGTHDERRRDRFQAPSGGDPFDLLRGVAPVAAGADHHRIRPAVELLERSIVSSIKKVLHLPRHGRKIFGAGEHITARLQNIRRSRLGGAQQRDSKRRFGAGTRCRSLGHLQSAARHRVVHDQNRLHDADVTRPGSCPAAAWGISYASGGRSPTA